MPRFFSEMGPNFYVMALLALVAAGMVAQTLRAVRWGREVRGWPLVLGLSLPLLFSVYASTAQFESWSLWVEYNYGAPGSDPMAYHTMTAMVLSKAVHTQMAAGLVTAAVCLGLLLGVIALTVEGDRPRLGVGSAGVALTAGLVLTASVTGLYAGPLGAALRVGLYLAAGLAATTALMSAHSRGPGVQAGTLTALAFPLLVAAVDQASSGYYAFSRFSWLAQLAPSAAKEAAIADVAHNLATLQSFSTVHLGLAVGLGMLGPLAAWRGEPDLARRHALAMAGAVVVCGLAVGLASHWALAI